MATDDILKEILDSLQRLEKDISDVGQSPSGRRPRPTEQFPKVELEILRKIQEHRMTCSSSMKEMVGEKVEGLLEKIGTIEANIGEIAKELGGRINGVKAEATKTATGSVVSLTDKVNKISEVVFGTRGEKGLEDDVRDLGQWVERREAAEHQAAEESKFNLTTAIQMAGIIVAIGLGLASLILR
jgi:hypothetical protein